MLSRPRTPPLLSLTLFLLWACTDDTPEGSAPQVSGLDGSVVADAGGDYREASVVLDANPPPTLEAGLAVDAAAADSDVSRPLPPGKDYGGWTWVETAGSVCRDGSPAGYYHRKGKTNALMIYLNGGGACADPFFCGLNPKNVDEDLPIELLIAGTLNLVTGPDKTRQLPPDEGVFKVDARNPLGNWSMVYVPYCTGDIHAGSNRDVMVKDVAGTQQFAGYTNFGLFLDSFGPSFAATERVLLTGSSAGGFGALINFDRTQEYFKRFGVEVMTISDSGVPMRNAYMAPCLQQRWRTYWGISKALPTDCAGCFATDGGSITEGLGNYLFKEKYKGKMLGGFISAHHDGIIRSFFAPGLSASAGQPDDCTLDPSINTVTSALLVGQYDGPRFATGLKDVIENVVGAEAVGYYLIPSDYHIHLWRSRYFEKNGTDKTIAEWVADILAKKNTKIGTY